MRIEPILSSTRTNATDTPLATVCPNCRTEMPREMRFCRACGFRLGEGVAEFTETVRFEKSPTSPAQGAPTHQSPRSATATTSPANPCASLNDWSALAKDIGEKAFQSVTQQFERQREKSKRQSVKGPSATARRRSRWMPWMIVAIIISVSSSGSLVGLKGLRNLRVNIGNSQSAPRSWVGTSDFKLAKGGVTFAQVEPEGSPADKAGLVGGDIVTTFDGQPVKSPGEWMKLLSATPIGKTVEVVYIRDGETKTTQLTTISEDEMDRLNDAADKRKEGYVGIGGSYEEVAVPGTNISGVQLNSVRRNNPAYIAGLRDGDIIIEFDGVPIRTYDELEARTRRAVPDSTIKVVAMRGSERLEIPVKVGVDD